MDHSVIQSKPLFFIIGAPRTGTNLLRDIICSSPLVKSWDCDEINFVWRFNISESSIDNLFDISEQHKAFIKNYILNFDNADQRFVVERLAQIRSELVSSGSCSRMQNLFTLAGVLGTFCPRVSKRWQGQFELNLASYAWKKIKNTPLRLLPKILWRTFKGRALVYLGVKSAFNHWGPITKNSKHSFSTEAAAAFQWIDCVNEAIDALEQVPPSAVYKLSYDRLLTNSIKELQGLFGWMGLPYDRATICSAAEMIVYTKKDNFFPCSNAVWEEVIAAEKKQTAFLAQN